MKTAEEILKELNFGNRPTTEVAVEAMKAYALEAIKEDRKFLSTLFHPEEVAPEDIINAPLPDLK